MDRVIGRVALKSGCWTAGMRKPAVVAISLATLLLVATTCGSGGSSAPAPETLSVAYKLAAIDGDTSTASETSAHGSSEPRSRSRGANSSDVRSPAKSCRSSETNTAW